MSTLQIGWGKTDLTPEKPVLIAGQFHARLSEGVSDPLCATALALDTGDDHAVMVSCDFVGIPDVLRDEVRSRLQELCPSLDPMKVILNATHTHTGPELILPTSKSANLSGSVVDLGAMPVEEYVHFAVECISRIIKGAWDSRQPGAIAFGQDYAVVGRNRRWVDRNGLSTMYGNTDTPVFSHIEGYEDHSVGVLATRDLDGTLTGLIINIPCTAQVSENDYVLSADYWFEVRKELRWRLGESLFILPQCSAAGDQSPHLLFGSATEERMLRLKGLTQRQEIAQRVANAVEEILTCLGTEFDDSPIFKHQVVSLDLPMTTLTEDDVRFATHEAERLNAQYVEELNKLEADPVSRREPRWYIPVTYAYRRMNWFKGVIDRFEAQKHGFMVQAEVHVLRLGDAVFATNPFEYYLDFGIYIKARSKAVQTFLVQLAGTGSYVPSERSVSGGGYGSIPASNPVGPQGGWRLAETTIAMIDNFWSSFAR